MKKLIILIIIIISGYFLYTNFTDAGDKNLTFSEEQIFVQKGETFNSLLQKSGLSEFETKIYLRQNPPSFELQAGTFSLNPNMTVTEFIATLEKPVTPKEERLTIIEGWNIYDIDNLLVKEDLISTKEFSNFAKNYCENTEYCENLRTKYPFLKTAESLEGFLYPDTYNFIRNTFTKEFLVDRMLANFNNKIIVSGIISRNDLERIDEIINLASIVQKEANIRLNPSEAKVIAGILEKRFKERWQIGADATICYAHELGTQECTPAEVLKYLYEKNDYNTRTMTGLPKTPIANPERISIEAVVNPESSAYYYYLHAPDGKIYYGRNEAEHNRNKNLYLK